jgi:ABC-2 type transport system ATP-binding protein
VQSLNDRGVTVVLTTHYLEEAEELCDRIAIINHGKLIANKPTRELVDMAREKIVVVTLDADVTELPAHPRVRQGRARGRTGALRSTTTRDRVNAGEVLTAVNAMGHGIVDVSTREADLEDVFLNLTRSVA